MKTEYTLLIIIFILAILTRSYIFRVIPTLGRPSKRFLFCTRYSKGRLKINWPTICGKRQTFSRSTFSVFVRLGLLLIWRLPTTPLCVFRIYNALGVFLVYLIGSKLFGKKIGFLASLLFAISYEQSQYSLFMSTNHWQ